MFYYEYVNLCNKRNMSPSAVAEEMGFHRSDVTRWSKGSQPRQATLQKIADYFGVSVSELTGEEQKEKPPAQGGEPKILTPDRYKEFLSEISTEDLISLLSEATSELKERSGK